MLLRNACKRVPEGKHDSSLARSAWENVPRKNGCRKWAQCFLRKWLKFCHSGHQIIAHTCTNHTVPYGTAPLTWRGPRHFVPGYDRTVPPGHLATGLAVRLGIYLADN